MVLVYYTLSTLNPWRYIELRKHEFSSLPWSLFTQSSTWQARTCMNEFPPPTHPLFRTISQFKLYFDKCFFSHLYLTPAAMMWITFNHFYAIIFTENPMQPFVIWHHFYNNCWWESVIPMQYSLTLSKTIFLFPLNQLS